MDETQNVRYMADIPPFWMNPRNLKEYTNWRMREARLVIKNEKAFLKVVFEKEGEKVEPKESVAVDI